MLALITGKWWLWGGLRMLLIGMATSAFTFGVDRLIGVTVS